MQYTDQTKKISATAIQNSDWDTIGINKGGKDYRLVS
jgi:hypothetical protein